MLNTFCRCAFTCTSFIFILILSLIFTNKINATVYLSDDFNANTNNWQFINGNCFDENSWKINNGKLIGEITKGYFSFIKADINIDSENYEITYKAINKSGVDQPLIFKISDDFQRYYMVNVRYKDPYWLQDGNSIAIGKFINGAYYSLADIPLSINLKQNIEHFIKVTISGRKIKVTIDSIVVADIEDREPFLPNGDVGFLNWGGDYSYRSSKNEYDDLIISSELKKKIIILPGLGASWNADALVYGNDASNSEWKMTPFVNNYNGLISALNQNGLVNKKDYFVWNYDWRKPIADIVSDFDSFVNNSVGSDDLDLVGHSLGGVIARVWRQNQTSNGRNINLYTLGSPHKGSVDAYTAWSGGIISDAPDIESVAINILLQLNKKNGESNLRSFREFVPILKDLLPTYDFVKRNNKFVSLNSLESKNDYLIQKNSEMGGLNINTYLGTGNKTKEYVNLAEKTVFDKILGFWPDGRLINYSYNDGDGTVLRNSDIGTSVYVSSNHGNIVDKSLPSLMNKLGLNNMEVNNLNDFSNSMVFFVGSPVDYSVTCGNNSFNQDSGLVIIKNLNYEKCTLNLIGTGDGVYHLVYGNTSRDTGKWHYVENKINNHENVVINFDPNSGEINKDSINKYYIIDLIRNDISMLISQFGNNNYLLNGETALNNNNVNELVNNIFKFRKVSKENKITVRILDNSSILYEIIRIDNENAAKSNYLKSMQNKSLIDKLTNLNYAKNKMPSEFSARSYLLASVLLDDMSNSLKSKKYTKVVANSMLVNKYLEEVW